MLRVPQATDVKEVLRKMAAFFARPLFGTKQPEDDHEVLIVKGRLNKRQQLFVSLLSFAFLLLSVMGVWCVAEWGLKHYWVESLCKPGWRGYSWSLLVSGSFFWLIQLSFLLAFLFLIISGIRICRARATGNPNQRTWFDRKIYLGRKAVFCGYSGILLGLIPACFFVVYLLPITISMTENIFLIRPEQIETCQQAWPSAL